MIGSSTIISDFIKEKFQLETLIKQLPDAFNPENKQAIIILHEIKNNFTPTLSII